MTITGLKHINSDSPERGACHVLGQYRSTQSHVAKGKAEEERLVEDMIELARQYGRYSYRP